MEDLNQIKSKIDQLLEEIDSLLEASGNVVDSDLAIRLIKLRQFRNELFVAIVKFENI